MRAGGFDSKRVGVNDACAVEWIDANVGPSKIGERKSWNNLDRNVVAGFQQSNRLFGHNRIARHGVHDFAQRFGARNEVPNNCRVHIVAFRQRNTPTARPLVP